MKVAYFCAEFALENNLPTYSGGLGVLAADVIREAGDQNVEMAGVGLYYSEGCSICSQDEKGNIVQDCEWRPAEYSGLRPVTTPTGERIFIPVPVQDHDVVVQAWSWNYKSSTVYFLDTNVPQNSQNDRNITNQLYDANKETRIKQEIILGIGGARLLKAINYNPDIYHSNDGHPAFLALELINDIVKNESVSFQKAADEVRQKLVFTNHTLVAAGNEVYSNDLVFAMLVKYSTEAQVPLSEVINLGLVQDSSIFSMTMFSLRLSDKVSTVSAIHSRKAQELWTNHPMIQVTNGVHLPTWDRVGTDDINELVQKHSQNKQVLLQHVNSFKKGHWDDNPLIIGWARRIVQYKRPLAIFSDLVRLAQLARTENRPIKIIFSGQPHPGDSEGISLFKDILKITNEQIPDISVFLPNYNLELAKIMTAGCDVWLNTPVVGFEACGTSGMKAALNGVLPITTKDGWVDEVDLDGIGWILDTNSVADSLFSTLIDKVVPLYYNTQNSNPSAWPEQMIKARKLAKERFNTQRVLKEYQEKLYSNYFKDAASQPQSFAQPTS